MPYCNYVHIVLEYNHKDRADSPERMSDMKYYIDNKEYSSLQALTDAMVEIAEVSKLTSHAWEASSMEELIDNLFCIHKAREYAENVAGWFGSGEELEYGGEVIWLDGRVVRAVMEAKDKLRIIEEHNPFAYAPPRTLPII